MARSTSHRWFEGWKEDGRLERIKPGMLSIVQLNGMIGRWLFFPGGKGVMNKSTMDIKGEGVTIPSLVDGAGNPLAVLVTAANESEREQVLPLLASIQIQTGEVEGPRQKPTNLATDGGYDSGELG